VISAGREGSRLTVIFFTTDVHGSEQCFMKFVNAAAFYNADVLILGGDVTGKMIIPLIDQGDGCRVAEFAGKEVKVKEQQECDTLIKNIRFSGYYPYLTTKEEMEDLNSDPKRVDALFTRLMGETMERWVKIAEERLKPKGIKCFITPGNDDRFIIDDVLSKATYVQNPEGKVVWVDEDHEMISLGWSNPTPWNSPREAPEEELEKRIEAELHLQHALPSEGHASRPRDKDRQEPQGSLVWRPERHHIRRKPGRERRHTEASASAGIARAYSRVQGVRESWQDSLPEPRERIRRGSVERRSRHDNEERHQELHVHPRLITGQRHHIHFIGVLTSKRRG
jgi:Icc-related predicted phosphoesterase